MLFWFSLRSILFPRMSVEIDGPVLALSRVLLGEQLQREQRLRHTLGPLLQLQIFMCRGVRPGLAERMMSCRRRRWYRIVAGDQCSPGSRVKHQGSVNHRVTHYEQKARSSRSSKRASTQASPLWDCRISTIRLALKSSAEMRTFPPLDVASYR